MGNIKVDGAYRIVEPKIYPVGLFWDVSKLRKLVWYFLSYPVSFLQLIWEQRDVLVRREQVSFRTRLSYRVKDAIDVFWIIVFSVVTMAVIMSVVFTAYWVVEKVFNLPH